MPTAAPGEKPAVSIWSELLDRIVRREAPVASHANVLRLPRIDGWEEGRVWCTWNVEADLIQPHGSLFGGYLSAVADEMVGMATMTVLDDKEVFVTASCRIDYFRPARAEELTVEATVVHRGRSSAYVEAAFKNAEGKLIAKASALQTLRRRTEE